MVRIAYEQFDGITAYLQRLMNMLFTLTAVNEKCNVSMTDTAINDLLDFSSDTYESLLYQMPEKQKEVFVAIVAEGNGRTSQFQIYQHEAVQLHPYFSIFQVCYLILPFCGATLQCGSTTGQPWLDNHTENKSRDVDTHCSEPAKKIIQGLF